MGLDIHRSDVRNRLGISDADFEAETTRRRITYTFNATRDLVLDSATCSNQVSGTEYLLLFLLSITLLGGRERCRSPVEATEMCSL